jgi:hypothetical protein
MHGVDAGGNDLTFLDHRVHEPSPLVPSPATLGLCGNFLQELCAHVLQRVLELDLLCDGHAVIGHRRCAEFLVQHDVPALRTKGHLDRRGHFLYAPEQFLSGVLVETELFGHVSPFSQS